MAFCFQNACQKTCKNIFALQACRAIYDLDILSRSPKQVYPFFAWRQPVSTQQQDFADGGDLVEGCVFVLLLQRGRTVKEEALLFSLL